jgi:molybdenum-dependent DNA-binding transcriptional regulator ModE
MDLSTQSKPRRRLAERHPNQALSARTWPDRDWANANLARFDLVSIRLAVYCAELGSLSAAAKRAHCSLSTSSYRLSALEHALGRPLFMRDYRGLRTTDAGDLFVRHASTILRQVELMNYRIRSLAPAATVANL